MLYMNKTFKIVLLIMLTLLVLSYALRQIVWTPPALGTEGDSRQSEIQVRDPTDISKVPPPNSFEESPVPPVEPVPEVGVDPTRCIQVQRCDSQGNCHWVEECR